MSRFNFVAVPVAVYCNQKEKKKGVSYNLKLGDLFTGVT